MGRDPWDRRIKGRIAVCRKVKLPIAEIDICASICLWLSLPKSLPTSRRCTSI